MAWANEIDRDACKTYRLNFPDTTLIGQDIGTLPVERVSRVDVIAAGFPCQPFSVCGKKQGFSDKRGNLFFEIMRFVDGLRPRVIFLENVANLVKHDNGRTFQVIYNELASRDYCIRYLVGDACDYGIPQHRTRIYIAAFLFPGECDRFTFPEKRVLNTVITDVIDAGRPADRRFYLSEESYEYGRLTGVIRDKTQLYRFSDYGIQASKDGISFTLKANMGTWRNRVPYIRDAYGIRRITPEECLALQGFPKEFSFPAIPERSAYRQAGNSVAVPLVKEIADGIRRVMSAASGRGRR